MDLNEAVGLALKQQRLSKGLSQETIGASQSYISDIERGLKAISVEKLDELAKNMGVHPLTILTNSYLKIDANTDLQQIFELISKELSQLEN